MIVFVQKMKYFHGQQIGQRSSWWETKFHILPDKPDFGWMLFLWLDVWWWEWQYSYQIYPCSQWLELTVFLNKTLTKLSSVQFLDHKELNNMECSGPSHFIRNCQSWEWELKDMIFFLVKTFQEYITSIILHICCSGQLDHFLVVNFPYFAIFNSVVLFGGKQEETFGRTFSRM